MRKIRFSYNVPVSFLSEGDHIVAYTPVLDLATSGKSFKEAEQRFIEVVEIFFEELIEMGTLDEVLSELGWQKVKKQWTPPAIIAHELKQIAITT